MVSAIAGSQSIWYKSMCTQRRVPLSADGLDVIGDGPVVVDGPADVCADPVVIDAGPVVINGSPVVVESGAVTIKCYGKWNSIQAGLTTSHYDQTNLTQTVLFVCLSYTIDCLPQQLLMVSPAMGFKLALCMTCHLYRCILIMKYNCSYECNISYGNNVPTKLHQFLKLGTRSEACFAGPTGCPSIALPLGAAHPFGDTQSSSISDR